MTTTFSRTREQLARMVLRKVGVLASGGSDVSADMEIVYEAVDLRLKEMHRLGTFWRTVVSVPSTFSLGAGIATASAGASVLFPLTMTFSDGSKDEPIQIIGVREYAKIVDKTQTGNPTKVLWKGGTEFIFWPVPSADGTAKLSYEQIADDTAAGTDPDIDVAMTRWVKDIIAYDLADEFGRDEVTIQRWMVESDKAERNIRKLNAQHVDYTTVAVDDFTDRKPDSRIPTDYGL
jgi:hypothetical protein